MFSQATNATQRYRLSLAGPRDELGQPASLAGRYDGSEAFSAKLWPGDDIAAVATLDAQWDDSLPGNPHDQDRPVVLLTVTADALVGVTPGVYRCQVLILPASEVWSDLFEVRPAPGTATALPAYCTLQDCQRVAPWLGEIEEISPLIQTNLAEQRQEARRWTDMLLQRHYRGERWYGNADRPLETSLDHLFWGIRRTGRDSTTLQGWLDDDRLVLTTASGRQLVRANAYYAVAEALKPQIGAKGDVSYQQLAAICRGEAERIVRGLTVEVDTSDPADGIGDVPIDLSSVDVIPC
jgi:hypothetical protein